MSKELSESLLPSSPLTAGESKLFFGVSSTSKVVIHYWSNFDSGDHLIHEMEVTQMSHILDIIVDSIQKFNLAIKNPSEYQLRMANGSGKPKTSMPAFDVAINALETGTTRFALCLKKVEKKEEFETVGESSPLLPRDDPQVKEKKEDGHKNQEKVEAPRQSLQQSGKPRRRFCCCFYTE
jgi:hypothetical protein